MDTFPPTCDVCGALSTPLVIPVTLTPAFPLDPLTPAEQCLAVQVVTNYITGLYPTPDPELMFDRVELKQPPKKDVLAFHTGDPLPRHAFVTVFSPTYDKYHAAVVNLLTAKVEKWEHIDKARPSWTNNENTAIINFLNTNPQVLAAFAARGITATSNPSTANVYWCVAVDGRLDNLKCSENNNLCKCKAKKNNGCDMCTDGMPNLEGKPRPRAYYAMPYILDYPVDFTSINPVVNYYLQPIGGIMVWFNTDGGDCVEMIQFSDMGATPINSGLSNFNCPPNFYYDQFRTLNPLQMCMPNGPSFVIDGASSINNGSCTIQGSGNSLTWDRWKMHFSLHPTWGLQLNLVQFNDQKYSTDPINYRSVLYQANLAEALTIYGSPDMGTVNHNFLDIGEYQTRLYITSLQPGVDVPPYANLYSPIFVQETGLLFQWVNGFAIYEQDGGMLWRHYDAFTGIKQGRRGRELVLTHTNCIGNYDYAFYWIFKQDGKIEVQVYLTGLDEYLSSSQKTTPPDDPFNPLLFQYTISPNHQHIFCYRLDFDVDGTSNRLYEENAVGVKPGKNNACSNAWFPEATLLKNTKEARRNIDPSTGRRWVFRNSTTTNSVGQSCGYALEPLVSTKSFSGCCSRIKKRAHLLNYNFFATPFKDDQLYPMGKYPVEMGKDEGLAIYSKGKKNLVDTDIVGWYSVMFTHDPETENFPVLPAEKLGFTIVPASFFNQNPAMNIDPNNLTCCSGCANCNTEQPMCPTGP